MSIKKILIRLFIINLSILIYAQKNESFSSLCDTAFNNYQKNKIEKAINVYQKALKLNPKNYKVIFNIGYLFSSIGNHIQAFSYYKKAIEIKPDYVKARRQLADLFMKAGITEQTIEQYKEIIKYNPENVFELYNCAHTLKTIGQYKESIPYYEKTIAIQPNHEKAQFGLAKALLATGNFEKGFTQFEWRMHNYKNEKNKNKYINFNLQSLKNKTVLIRSEFGLGDTIQFIRYGQKLKNIGVKKLIIETPAALIPIFSLCSFIDQIVQKGTVPTDIDFTFPLLSLPLLFKTKVETIPQTVPYLKADFELVSFWNQKLKKINPNNKILNIGICWHASSNTFLEQNKYTKRSIPLVDFAPIAKLSNIKLYSLQKIDGTEEIKNLSENFIHIFDNDFDNSNGRFMDSAALIQNLDLILTVDTSIAHLSGALATPVWILLPKAAEWRWMLEEKETPWYPTARIFRQKKYGDWQSVIEKIKNLLAQLT